VVLSDSSNIHFNNKNEWFIISDNGLDEFKRFAAGVLFVSPPVCVLFIGIFYGKNARKVLSSYASGQIRPWQNHILAGMGS